MDDETKTALMVGVPVGIALFAGAIYYATRPPQNGNGVPPPGCQDGTVLYETCPDGSQIVTHQCVNGQWQPTGNQCLSGPCDAFPPGSEGWCRCQLGDAESREIGDIQVQYPLIFSLIPQVPDFPRNPEGYIDIFARDKCGGPKSGAIVVLSQSTTEWGGFVIPGYQNVNCARSGEMQAGVTGPDGRMRVRYLVHHNPGLQVAQSINITIKVWGQSLITDTGIITVNGTHGAWPFDPFMITKEKVGGSPWRWYDCP